MYTYIRSEPGLWTVGSYDPEGKWMPESDTNNVNYAAARVNWLNGGPSAEPKEDDYKTEP